MKHSWANDRCSRSIRASSAAQDVDFRGIGRRSPCAILPCAARCRKATGGVAALWAGVRGRRVRYPPGPLAWRGKVGLQKGRSHKEGNDKGFTPRAPRTARDRCRAAEPLCCSGSPPDARVEKVGSLRGLALYLGDLCGLRVRQSFLHPADRVTVAGRGCEGGLPCPLRGYAFFA